LRFTVRRPASAEASPCCHRPPGGDVACSVHVGVARPGVAGFALENGLALTVFGRDVPARRASLRRVCGRDLFDPTVSLVLQTRGEQTPTASARTPGKIQTAFLCHPLAGLLHSSPRSAGHRKQVKGFDADHLEAPRDVSGGLFDPVLASGSLTRLQLRDRKLRASPPVGTARGASQSLLHRLRPGRQPIVLAASRSQLSTLLVVPGPAAPRLPVQLLLDRQVPHKPGMATMLAQHHRLLSGGKQPISRHPGNPTATTDKSPKGETASPPPAKAKGMHAARIP
jgi:hypothetical protein